MITFISSDQTWPYWAWLGENKERTDINLAELRMVKKRPVRS